MLAQRSVLLRELRQGRLDLLELLLQRAQGGLLGCVRGLGDAAATRESKKEQGAATAGS